MTDLRSIAAIAIGRNEGDRLIACLQSLHAQGLTHLIYVDSGSTDGSPASAAALGAKVVSLDGRQPFTAARARNAGLAALADNPPELIQMIDGDCTLVPGWIETAVARMDTDPHLAVVCGRLRERHPGTSLYNRHCDREWNTPLGPDTACGGIALFRHAALLDVGGYTPDLIAGEEPDLCLRLRRAGWRTDRIAAEMALHDAAILRFGQFWRRSRRAGHAYAEGHWRHRTGPERHYRRETMRALLWGAVPPLLALLALPVLPPLAAAILLVYPAQTVRLAARDGFTRDAWENAALLTVSKPAEALGVIAFHIARLRRRRIGLIEYR